MTFRALILGLLGAALIIGTGYVIGNILQLPGLTSGGLLPMGVLVLILVAGAGVVLLRLLVVVKRFSGGELAVIVAILMVACSINSGALNSNIAPALALPMHFNQRRPGWRKNQLLSYVPAFVLPADGKYDIEVVQGFLTGLATDEGNISLSDVPWDKWARSLTVWMPLIALSGICMTCMALVVHRQWSQRERLR